MVALARTCQQYGRFRDARALLQAAGAHGELLALCVFQGDFPGLQGAARAVRAEAEAWAPATVGLRGARTCRMSQRLHAALAPLTLHPAPPPLRCRRGAMWAAWPTSWRR